MGHAEVREVWPRGGQIRIVGEIIGVDCGEHGRWSLLLAARRPSGSPVVRRLATRIVRGPAIRRYPADVRDGAFEVKFPVQAVVAFPQWDLYLGRGKERLRLGRHLDDITDLQDVFVFPRQKARPTRRMALLRSMRGSSLRGRFRRSIRIRPRYTGDNHLVIGEPAR